MYYIRVVKTASESSAVQVLYYRNRKRVVFKHIGSANNLQDLDSLKLVAQDVINNSIPQISLFEEVKFDNLLYVDHCDFLGVYFTFLH